MEVLEKRLLGLCPAILGFWMNCQSLEAQPLNISFNVEIANAPKEEDQILLIPTQFEIIRTNNRRSSQIDFKDPDKLYIPYRVVLDPQSLSSKKKEGSDICEANPKIQNLTANLEDLSLKTGDVSTLFLHGTGVDLFTRPENWTFPLMIEDLCKKEKKDLEKNMADCSINFPSIQVHSKELDNISYIRFRVFRKGHYKDDELTLPTDLLSKKQEVIADNTREKTEDVESKENSAYLLYANYHFDAALKASDNGMKNMKAFEWRYALSQASGRLALIPGDYLIEREISFADGNKKFQSLSVKLEWAKYISQLEQEWKSFEPTPLQPTASNASELPVQIK